MILLFVSVLVALIFDLFFGEVKRFHPLVGFGSLAMKVEQGLNSRYHQQPSRTIASRLIGLIAYLWVVAPVVWLSLLLTDYSQSNVVVQTLFAGSILYFAIGWRSLLQHAKAISKPLKSGDLKAARHAVSMIVSRDTQSLDEPAIASAATESVLENGADAIFSAIFWFLLAGVPGVVLYRLSNTLDAMWGYKNERFLHFGWAAARIDDVMNFIPARLTALSYAIMGNTRLAFQCWKSQGRSWKSPNAGPVMAAGAGALSVSLGGEAPYHGEWQTRPTLGPAIDNHPDAAPSARSIEQACRLVNQSLYLWLGVIFAITLLGYYSGF